MDWITSEGGPLICLEKKYEESWGGIDTLSVASASARSDYERACMSSDYARVVPLVEGSALLLGNGALDTAFWHSPSGMPFLVSVFFSEANVDEAELLKDMPVSIFSKPISSHNIRFGSSELVIFDSAVPGTDGRKVYDSTIIDPGAYVIRTQEYNPKSAIYFLLHQFCRIF